jgi:multidrug efflux pump
VLHHTLGARSAVLLACAVIMVAIVIMFVSSPHELAPQQDQGCLFVQTKGLQYATVEFMSRSSQEVERAFRSWPDDESSWFGNGTDGQNDGCGGVILKDWSERERSAGEIQA